MEFLLAGMNATKAESVMIKAGMGFLLAGNA